MTFMQALIEFVKSALIPGSLVFQSLGLIVGVSLLYGGPRLTRWARWWLTSLAVLYGLLALPIVSNGLSHSLQAGYARVETSTDGKGADVLAVIGAGVVGYDTDGRIIHEMTRRTAFTVLEAARVYQLTHPSWIIASGGIPDPAFQTTPESEIIRDELVKLGVPCNRILIESESRSTAEQVANITHMLRERRLPPRLIIVMTPAHARRVMLLAARQKINAVPAVATALRYDPGEKGWREWRPSAEALRGSEAAIYEYLAVTYAWLRG
jgi:uncharacterized SAM-binding protein YcdF (DUF218 family)